MPGSSIYRGLSKPISTKPVFTFKVPRRRPSVKQEPAVLPGAEQAESEKVGPIQGKMPGSIQEWRLAKALDRAKIKYIYQLPLWGGWVVGGYILDFLVLDPFEIAVAVQGTYWHSARMDRDRELIISRLEHRFGVGRVKEAWEDDLESIEEASAWIKRNL